MSIEGDKSLESLDLRESGLNVFLSGSVLVPAAAKEDDASNVSDLARGAGEFLDVGKPVGNFYKYSCKIF